MTTFIRVEPTIEVHTQLGKGNIYFIIDYGLDVNTVYLVRLRGGIIKHFYSDDVLIYDNPMNGNGLDIEIPKNWKQ
jgi:hypothetical protein